MQRVFKVIILLVTTLSLGACATTPITPPPHDIHNACSMFNEYPKWKDATIQTEERWHIPVSVQMAIVKEESDFVADARPERAKLLGFLPSWKHVSSAYGYSQALNGTWKDYLDNTHQYKAKREEFTYGVDFIGWYADQVHNKLHIPLNDPYRLYLAYHEGLGGYSRQSFLRKPWLIHVARKVKQFASLYQQQLRNCNGMAVV